MPIRRTDHDLATRSFTEQPSLVHRVRSSPAVEGRFDYKKHGARDSNSQHQLLEGCVLSQSDLLRINNVTYFLTGMLLARSPVA